MLPGPTSNLPKTNWPLGLIPEPRRVAIWVLVCVLVINSLCMAYFQSLAFPEPETWFPALVWLRSATGGLFGGTLVASITSLVLVLAMVVGLGGLGLKDIGLDIQRLWPSLKVTIMVWIVSQVVLIFLGPPIRINVSLNPVWFTENWRKAAGDWLGQVFGNCPFEEVFYRGFLLTQTLLICMSLLPAVKRWIPLAMAIVLSQGYFAICHIFLNSRQAEGQWLLLVQFFLGLIFAGVYIRTGNLFLAMGLHTLFNNPAPLIRDSLPGPGVGGMLAVFLGLAWIFFSGCFVKAGQIEMPPK